MNRFYEGIVDFIEENGNAEKEYRDVYLYAVQTVAVYLFNICSGLAIGALMGEIVYCIFFLAAFILLRQEAGGYHARGWKSCYVLSCGVLVLTLFWIKESFVYQTYITVAAAVAAAAVILFLAPLEDENRPLDKQEKKAIRRKAQLIAVAEMIAGTGLLFWDRRAAYAVFYAVVWCGAGCMAWVVKRHFKGKFDKSHELKGEGKDEKRV